VTAQYPSTVKSFTTKVDFTDTVLAEHVNSLQDEVNSIESNLGTSIKTGSGWVGSFDLITTSWNTLKDRIANIEYGIKSVYDRTAVSPSGGSTIQSTLTSTTSLVVKAVSSQSANLIEFQKSDSTVVTKVQPNGTIYTRGKELVPVIYAATQPTGSDFAAGTIWVDSSTNVDATLVTTGASIVDTLMLMGG